MASLIFNLLFISFSGKEIFQEFMMKVYHGNSRKLYLGPGKQGKGNALLTLTLTSESVYGSQFFHCKLLQVLMS
jgi:hypothetical protein